MSQATSTTPERRARTAATPAIDALLRRLRSRLLREVWIFGLGRTLLAVAVWLLFSFVIDWTLHVPRGVRLVNFALLFALPSAVLWRDLISRLRRVPDEAGLAILIERAQPKLQELLVSAVQLNARGGVSAEDETDPRLIEKVIVEAEALAGTLDLKEVTDSRAPRSSFLLGALSAAVVVLTFVMQGPASAIFFARIAGGSTPWPQHTHLVVEIPLGGDLHKSRDELELAVARGSDLPVIVRAEGKVPDDVRLVFEGGHEALLGSAGRDVFRTLLRSVQEDITFHVEGGDDRDGTPRVRIRVLQPPDVSRIAVRILPPAYSGLPERIEFDRDVQVLADSHLTVYVLPNPLNATGLVRLLPKDETIELGRSPFPDTPLSDASPSDASASDGGRAAQPAAQKAEDAGLSFEVLAKESLRYRFELQDATGLSNPNPGLFAIEVAADRAPEVDLISPARGELESVVGGALQLKVIASDDFGLSRLHWRSIDTSTPELAVAEHELELAALALVDDQGKPQGERTRAFASQRIEVNALFGPTPPTEGEVFQIDVSAADNREPSPQETRSAAVRLRIVSADEFLRRIQDRLARVRAKVEALASLIGDKQGYTRDLLASLESDEPSRADASGLHTALTGARRVEGDAKALSRELAAIAEALLYSRLDDRAGPMLTEFERRNDSIADRNFHAEPWIELCEMQSQGRLGKADFADRLVEMVGISLSISERDAMAAIDDLRRAQDMADMSAQYDSLVRVLERQSAARASTERLLSLLSEWDSYQSLLSATRDILTRQKNLLDRTQQYYKDN